jgi:hypothetical protein
MWSIKKRSKELIRIKTKNKHAVEGEGRIDRIEYLKIDVRTNGEIRNCPPNKTWSLRSKNRLLKKGIEKFSLR